jgi:hypothetical protein
MYTSIACVFGHIIFNFQNIFFNVEITIQNHKHPGTLITTLKITETKTGQLHT